MEEPTNPRYVGADPVTGKNVFVISPRGGMLSAVADIAGLEAATALLAVVTSILEAGEEISDAERAAFIEPMAASLAEVIGIAAHRIPENAASHAAAEHLIRGTLRKA
ncbi:hypothetical protein AB0N06_09825 [Streptomyces sp. NPDC051020]|uniref:hypothetical protein n=1 Tax=Streptomyces sp. NPDC051020 TaxID=3155409 RepID=UPI00343DDC0B